MGTLLQDVRHGLRALRRAPGFTLVAVLTLGLGIGANTAIFSVLYGVLIRPLPYPDPGRLVTLAQVYQGATGEMATTYGEFRYLQREGTVFQSVAATTSVGFNLFTGAQAERLHGLRVSESYFRTLGISPMLGRGFVPEEDQPGGPAALVLSHGLWQRSFGADPGVIGRRVLLDGDPYTVVGVMPAGLDALSRVDAWSTLAQVGRTIGSGQNLELIGRLKPGLSLAQARAGFEPTTEGYREEFSRILPKNVGITIAPYRDVTVENLRLPLRVLFGAIGFVLLIACANVASLVLGRSTARSRELAVRVALGATPSRLMRQLLTESLLLALLGGLVGLALADGGLGFLLTLVPRNLPRLDEIRLDGWVLLFTAGVSVATGFLFGLAPAWHAVRVDLQQRLKAGAGRTTGSAGQGRLRNLLIVGETALSLVLLVGAGLLIQTFSNLTRTDPGFATERVLTGQIWLTGTRYDSPAAISAFYDRLTGELGALPGVESAAVVEAGLPLNRGGNLPVFMDGEFKASTDYRTITPNYFDVLQVPLTAGRGFTAADREGSEPVAIVNQTFASRVLGEREPLGQLIKLGGASDSPRRVVGVVRDVRSFIGFPAPPTAFIPSAQTPVGFTRVFSSWFPTYVVLRTAGDPDALSLLLAKTIHATDPQVPVGRIRSMSAVLGESLAFQRFLMLLLTLFAGLAIVLAAVGLYGVMSYLVTQRTGEIGIRMALGARAGEVRRLVIGRGLRLTGLGVGLGLLGAAGLTRFLGSQLYEVQPMDPLTLAVVAALLVGVALLACYLPARRATLVDPIVALRNE